MYYCLIYNFLRKLLIIDRTAIFHRNLMNSAMKRRRQGRLTTHTDMKDMNEYPNAVELYNLNTIY